MIHPDEYELTPRQWAVIRPLFEDFDDRVLRPLFEDHEEESA